MQRDINANWERLTELVRTTLPPVRAQQYLKMMNNLYADRYIDQATVWLGFCRAPAAKGNHHDFEGGLVAHLLEMWDIWQVIRPLAYAAPYVTDERILEHIINHDLHKASQTFTTNVNTTGWFVEYGRHDSDQFLSHDQKSLWLLNSNGIELDMEQVNALYWSEGGFSKNAPRESTVLAKVGYILDEMSGNVVERIRKRTFLHRSRAEA